MVKYIRARRKNECEEVRTSSYNGCQPKGIKKNKNKSSNNRINRKKGVAEP